jgi:glutamate dehydrogenase (NAD(P)+)
MIDIAELGIDRTLTTVLGADDRPAGWLALNSSVRRRAVGGIRCTPDINAAEVASLADAMSWKFAFLGMPMGGAKAGLIESPAWGPAERVEAIRRFGRALGPLLRSRVYGAGTDMGFGPEDLWEFSVGAGRVSGPPPPASQRGNTGEATALTVYACVVEALRAVRGQVVGATVALEGFGAVGSTLAGMLDQSGVRVVGVSNRLAAIYRADGLDVSQLQDLRTEHGDEGLTRFDGGESVGHQDLLALDADVLVPCARPWSLNSLNASSLQCLAVVAAANCPIHPELGEEGLESNGILVVPDFVANSGGILYANLPASGRTRSEILKTGFPDVVSRLFTEREANGQTVTRVARAIAVARARVIQHDRERADRELAELDTAFDRWRSGVGRRLYGERPAWKLARRWLATEGDR